MGKFKLPSGMSFPTSGLPKIPITPNMKLPSINLNEAGKLNIPSIKDVKVPDLNGIGDQIRNIPEIKESGLDIPDANLLKDLIQPPSLPSVTDIKSTIGKVKEIKPSDVKDAVKSKYDEAKTTINAVKNEGATALIPDDVKQLGQMAKDSGIFKKED